MKKFLFAVLFTTSFGLTSVHAAPLTGSTVKMFDGPNGVQVEIVYLDPAADKLALVKVTGAPDSPLNGKVIKVKRTNAGTGENWSSDTNGKIVLTTRKNYGDEVFELYQKQIPGDSIYLTYSKKDTATAKAADLITEFSKK